MLTNLAFFEAELDKIIERRLENLRDSLEINNYDDVGQFRFVMGQIAALRSVKNELIPEVKELMDKLAR